MTRERVCTRCIPISLAVLIAVCALLIGATTGQAASGPSATVAYSSNGVTASIRAVQPAVSGLFQVHAPRAWVDALDESGQAGQNSVPDFLDTWEAFRARASSAILKNGYAFTTIEELGREILYAGVESAPTGGPSSVVLEFNQKLGERLLGDLRIGIEIDAAGSVGTVRFESYSGEAKGSAEFLPVAILAGEGCNDAGTACVVANGALLEVGINLSQLLNGAGDRFKGIQITTPEDHVVGTMSAFAGATGGCVKEVGGINPVCTANDVRLAGAKNVVIAPGDTCDPNDPNDTITIQSFTGIFTSGPQRYDIGSYIATDGGGADGARTGQCTRFAFKNLENGTLNLDNDSCGDIAAGATLEIPLGPLTIKCQDAFAAAANGGAVAGSDGNIDFFHCETWAQSAGEINCLGSASVKAGTPSKCGCGFLGAAAGFCLAAPSDDPCFQNVCQGTCQNVNGGGSHSVCATNGQCTTSSELCRGITVVQVNLDGPQPGCNGAAGECVNGQQCSGGSCVGGDFKTGVCADDGNVCTTDLCSGSSSACIHAAGNAGTVCHSSAGACDVAETCNGTSADCPADGKSTAVCRASDGACDPAESCDGTSNDCPADAKSTAVCHPSQGVCDPAESCDGTSNDCPADAKSTAVCHPSQGVCDPAESCDGTSNDCPADAKSTASCRVSAGVCDVAESCNGTSNDCPADAKSTASCRASAGDCDIEEFCDGTNTSCPADGFKSSSVVCRESIERCDLSEHCTGTSAECPGESCSGS